MVVHDQHVMLVIVYWVFELFFNGVGRLQGDELFPGTFVAVIGGAVVDRHDFLETFAGVVTVVQHVEIVQSVIDEGVIVDNVIAVEIGV